MQNYPTIALIPFVALILNLCDPSCLAQTNVLEYGDEDMLNTGPYPSDPKAGATLVGLAPGVFTLGPKFAHTYPFTPTPTDYLGTDQIFVGSGQSTNHDGYSKSALRRHGPQVITLDYSALVPAGQTVATFTLGIGADDFEQPMFMQPFTASINGAVHTNLTDLLNTRHFSGPIVRFITFGLEPSILRSNAILTLTIDEGGDGGDGWAIDYLTVGVTTAPRPRLGIARLDDSRALLSWPTNSPGYSLQSATNLAAPIWIQATNNPSVSGTQFVATVDFAMRQRVFRLFKLP